MFTRICHHSWCPILMPISGQTDAHRKEKLYLSRLLSAFDFVPVRSPNLWMFDSSFRGHTNKISVVSSQLQVTPEFGILSSCSREKIYRAFELLWSRCRTVLYTYIAYATYHLDNHFFSQTFLEILKISKSCMSTLPDGFTCRVLLTKGIQQSPDKPPSSWSAALHAAGAVLEAVDQAHWDLWRSGLKSG